MKNESEALLGLRHAALAVRDLPRAIAFYRDLLGFAPYAIADADWAMLARGTTSLSLVRAPAAPAPAAVGSHPAHLGFVVETRAAVDALHARLVAAKVTKIAAPKLHRDESYGFYFADPDDNQLEAIFIPAVPVQVSTETFVLVGDDAVVAALFPLLHDHLPGRRLVVAKRETLAQVVAGLKRACVIPVLCGDAPLAVAASAEVRLLEPLERSRFFRQGLLECLADRLLS